MQRHHWIAVALALATLFAFEPVRGGGFVEYDDNVYLTENPHVQHGLSARDVGWAFNAGYASNWHPLTWFSHMLDVSVWGMNPHGHHVTNLLLHLASVLLLFFLLRRMTGEDGKSAFVAAVFAVHPLHVESVAWISERKDVLSALLGLAAIWFWVDWTEKGGPRRYLLALALFALALMAKPMLASLPFLLLLLDFWPLRRLAWGASAPAPAASPAVNLGANLGASSGAYSGAITGASAGAGALPVRSTAGLAERIKEKLPFFALTAGSCVMTLIAQQRDLAIVGANALPLPFRFANAACSYVAYVGKALWPAKLAFFYPYPGAISISRTVVSSLILVAATVFVLLQARKRPWLAVGWLWWMGMLVPVIGFVQVGRQSMADRYMYLPLVGLAMIAAWGLGDLFARRPAGRLVSTALAAALVLIWAVGTRAQAATWKDDFRLFGHAIEVTEGNDVAYNGLGLAHFREGRLEDAKREYSKALEVAPRNAKYHNDVGIVLEQEGSIEQAMAKYEEALRLDPDLVVAHANLARVLDSQERFEESMPHYLRMLELAPDRADVRGGYAVALASQGRFEESLEQFEIALRFNDTIGDIYLNQAITLANLGRIDEAIASLRQGIRLRPDRVEAQGMLEQLLRAQNEGPTDSTPR